MTRATSEPTTAVTAPIPGEALYGGKIVGVFNTVGDLNDAGASSGTDLPNFSAGGAVRALSNTNLLAVCNGMVQSSTQNVAVVGASGTGDVDWNNNDWSTLTTWAPMDAADGEHAECR